MAPRAAVALGRLTAVGAVAAGAAAAEVAVAVAFGAVEVVAVVVVAGVVGEGEEAGVGVIRAAARGPLTEAGAEEAEAAAVGGVGAAVIAADRRSR